MPPELEKYLRDMLDAARAITDYTHDKTEEEYLRLRAVRDAVQGNFCVIGEALSQLRVKDAARVQRITD